MQASQHSIISISPPVATASQIDVLAPVLLRRSDQSVSSGSTAGGGGGRLMQEVGWQEGVIQSVANFMFQNRRQVPTVSDGE